MTTSLPEHVVELLRSRIDSFEKLELVVALHSTPRATMSVDELCGALKLSRAAVREAALELRTMGLADVTARNEVQLLPLTSRDAEAVTDLVRLYTEDRIAIVRALGEIAIERIRNVTVRTFADAFLLRKPRKDDDHG